MKPFTTIAVIILALFALVHLFRLIRGIEVLVGGHPMPLWASAVAAIVAGTLALMVWWESRRP
jgi:predicted Co/Zn/Cd cation transporter (cation efflux family)